MKNKSKIKTQTQFTKEQNESTPKEILEVLFKYMEKEINSTKREVIFLETTLRRIKEKKLPEMQNELETLLSNRESQAKIKQQRKLINECTDNYNKTIKNYHEINEYLNILKKDALKIAKVLKCNLN